MTRRNTLVWRWSIISTSVLTLFWFVWYLIVGSVPEASQIVLWPGLTVQLPFPISRWYDLLLGPIYSYLIVYLLTSKQFKDSLVNEDIVPGLLLVIGAGLSGLLVGAFFGLFLGLGVVLVLGLVFGLAFGLVFGLGTGLGTGLAFGLAFWLFAGLVILIIFSIIFSIIFVIKKIFCQKTVDWLSAKDIKDKTTAP